MTTEIPTGYKQTSIGIIPEDWKVERLQNLFPIFKSGNGITSEKIFEFGNYPVYGGNGLRGYTDSSTHSGEFVLIGRQGALCGNVKFVSGEIFISEHAIAVNSNNENSLKFWFFKFDKMNLNRLSESSAQPGLSVEKLLRIKVSLPPLPEQQKIAEILSTWDEAIETCQKTIEELKLRNKGLAQRLLSGKTRVKGFENTVWKFIKIGEILSESVIPSINESNPDKRITVKLNLNGIEKRDFRGTEVEGATYFYTRKAGQFIYGKQNLHKGAFGIIPQELDNFDSSSDIPTFDFSEKFSPHFILYYFSRKSFYERLENYSTGTGSKRIQPKELFKVEIKIPDYEEQKRIVEILDTAASELKRYEEKLQNLKLQKKGLMQVLLTGKVRVR